jgi:competence protein ComGC
MASQDSKGSLILKIVIVLLVVAMVIAIKLPGQIWQEEDKIRDTSRGNMATLYEAQRYFYSLKGVFSNNEDELIATIQNDSALSKRQLVVNHTTRLKDAMEKFLNTSVVQNLYAISSNIKSVEDDLNANKRFFKTIEEIDREAEELKMQIHTFRSAADFENYALVMTALDSMWQLRRDLTDYSLQSAARYAHSFSKEISETVSSINFNDLNQVWVPISNRTSDLMEAVLGSKLKSLTSVADRVADFQRDASEGFTYFINNKTSASLNEVAAASEDLSGVYNEFLSDFLITEEYAQYALSESDSLLINISKNSFYTPDKNLAYIMKSGDSLRFRVEDPTLLEDLKSKASSESARIGDLPFMNAFSNYEKQIEAIKEYYPQVKAKYRRNIDIMIKSKELEAAIEELPESAAYDAYLKEKSYVQLVPMSDSYSAIKEEVESALISTGAFKQIYSDNFFGTLDTIHIEIINQMNEYNELLSEIRRNEYSFETHINALSTALEQIKSVPKESVLSELQDIEQNLKDLYLFASEGKEQSVYGVFNTRIVNYGKIFGSTGQKSWEE